MAPAGAADEKISRFLAWCAEREIVVARDAVAIDGLRPEADADDGADGASSRAHLRVRASRDIALGEILFEIPKTTVVCASNAGAIGAAVRAGGLGGGLALNVTIAMALLGGPSSTAGSFWDGYAEILPRRGERSLPMYWDEDERRSLTGTELEECLEEDDEAFEEDYATAVEALGKEMCDAHGFTLETYKAAASIAASRAFCVGGRYGECLVPCADLFNHRTGTNSVAVFGIEDSDDDCDEGHNDDTGALIIKTVVDVKAGEELFNTFGSKSNTNLLHRYGFAETHNKDTACVTIDSSLFVDVFGEEVMSDVYERLQETSADDAPFLEFFESDKYYEITIDGCEHEFYELVEALIQTGKLKHPEHDRAWLVGLDENKAVHAVVEEIIYARWERYGKPIDRREPERERELTTSAFEGMRHLAKPLAGGGVVGQEAAQLVKMQEVDLIYDAIRFTAQRIADWCETRTSS
jgi:SET domain-containing protein 6